MLTAEVQSLVRYVAFAKLLVHWYQFVNEAKEKEKEDDTAARSHWKISDEKQKGLSLLRGKVIEMEQHMGSVESASLTAVIFKQTDVSEQLTKEASHKQKTNPE